LSLPNGSNTIASALQWLTKFTGGGYFGGQCTGLTNRLSTVLDVSRPHVQKSAQRSRLSTAE